MDRAIKITCVFAIILMITSCTTTRYVTVPEYHYKDSVRFVNHRDSIYSRDSIFIYSKGDTIYHEHFSVKYKEFIHNDTVLVIHRDSIYTPCPVVTEKVVHSMYWWQETLLWIGIIAIIIMAIQIVLKMRKSG